MTTKVLITDKLATGADDILRARGVEVDRKVGIGRDELLAIIDQYDGLAVRSETKPDAEIIAKGAAGRLKVIGRAGIGVDNIDVKAATDRGVVVMNTPFGNAVTTAEHAIALLFAAARQLGAADASTQAGKWEKSRFKGVELYNKTLGVIGCGNIGSLVAERALGLKMRVIAFDPFLTKERAAELGVEKVELEELLKRADAITLHTPLTEQTRNILSAENLAKTKKGVILVNAARGGLVDEAAVARLLEEGHVGAAAFDVFIEEPATANPLFGKPNFLATPHLGAATQEAQDNVAFQVAEQIADYLLTGAVTNAVNAASVSAEDAPKLKPYLALGEKMGALAGQIAASSVNEIELIYEGAVAKLNVKPVTAAALAGVLRPMLESVNPVSAPAIAQARGIKVSETRQEKQGDFFSRIRLAITTENAKRSFAGAIFGGEPRIIEAEGVPLDAAFHPHMLYVVNEDKPGFIGAIGALLAEAGVNIASFHLGRKEAGGQATSLIAVDSAPSADTLARIRALPQVEKAEALQF